LWFILESLRDRCMSNKTIVRTRPIDTLNLELLIFIFNELLFLQAICSLKGGASMSLYMCNANSHLMNPVKSPNPSWHVNVCSVQRTSRRNILHTRASTTSYRSKIVNWLTFLDNATQRNAQIDYRSFNKRRWRLLCDGPNRLFPDSPSIDNSQASLSLYLLL
jgi:hypothetical protein